MNIDNTYLENLKGRIENPVGKHKFEFQEVCAEIEEELGKGNKSGIWSLPHQVGVTEHKLRRTLAEFRKRKFGYFMYLLTKVIK
jgi:hypothetical protein